MFKFIKKIKELEKRILALENALIKVHSPLTHDSKTATYEEVIDEWLNGKRA